MKLVIWTDFNENYGAHDWDGEGACPQYWKSKPGSIYVVENLTEAQADKIRAKGIPTLCNLIEYSHDYAREMVVNYRLVEDSVTLWEEWEEPTFLAYAEGSWNGQQFKNAPDHGFHASIRTVIEKYELLPKGKRGDLRVYYITHDNEVLSGAEWTARYANSANA